MILAASTASTPAVQTYTKGSGSSFYPSWTVALGGATNGQIFSVNPTTLGSWLTASPLSGAYGTSNTITFQATGGIDALAAQSTPYTQVVHISVSGYADTTVSISLVVSNPTATLSSGNFGKILTANDPRILEYPTKTLSLSVQVGPKRRVPIWRFCSSIVRIGPLDEMCHQTETHSFWGHLRIERGTPIASLAT